MNNKNFNKNFNENFNENFNKINTDFLLKKKDFIINYNLYLNTINHKCVTNSCKRRHEIIIGDFLKSFNTLQNFKNKI